MVDQYEGVPNKKRKAYVGENGSLHPLDLGMAESERSLVTGSGVMSAGGDCTVTGTYFSPQSVVTTGYNDSSKGTDPIAVIVSDGTATFKGDANTDFYFMSVK